jgi:hypothetical protein
MSTRFAPVLELRRRETTMTNVHSTIMDLMPKARAAIGQIRRSDFELADDMERCFTRVALDHAVASATRGKTRLTHFESALAAAARLHAAYDLAQAFGYLKGDDDLSPSLRDIARAIAALTAVARATAQLDAGDIDGKGDDPQPGGMQ